MAKINIVCYALGILFGSVALGIALTVAQEAWKSDEHVKAISWSAFVLLLALAAAYVGALPMALQADAERVARSNGRDGPSDEFKLEQRAWVAATAFAGTPPAPTIGQPLEVRTTIKNSGKTPARNVVIRSVFEPLERGKVPTFDYSGDAVFPLGAMQPEKEHFSRIVITRKDGSPVIPMNQATFNALRSGAVVIWAHGRVEYEDIFGDEHWAEWCYFWSAPDFLTWSPYTEHNGFGTNSPRGTVVAPGHLDESKRAWMTVKSATLIQDFAVGKPLRAVIRVTNTGQTPALEVIVTGDIVTRESIELVPFETEKLAHAPPSVMVIAPGAIGTVEITSKSKGQIGLIPSQAHIDAFLDGPYMLFVRGFITYKDVDGKTHKTIYCFKAEGRDDLRRMTELGVGMSACDRWNTAE